MDNIMLRIAITLFAVLMIIAAWMKDVDTVRYSMLIALMVIFGYLTK